MTRLRPPIAGKPTGVWNRVCTIQTPVEGQDADGSPSVTSYTDTATNLPCRIDPTGGTEAMEYGVGDVHRTRRQFIGYFPTHDADGATLTILANARVVVGSTRYECKGPASPFDDGVQSVPLEVQP